MARTLSLLFTLLIVTMISCQKEVKDDSSNDFINELKVQLAAKMEVESYNKVDFHKVVLSQIGPVTLIRIPFLNESIAGHFVLLEMERGSRTAIAGGAIISLGRAASERIPTHFSKYSLDGLLIDQSTITDGYIDAYHPLLRVESMQDPYKELPEVIVTANYSDAYNPVPPSEWYYLSALLHSGGGGNSDNGYYGMADPPMGGGGGSYVPGGYTGGPVLPAAEEKMMEFEKEYVYSEQQIDVAKYFNCFNNVPSTGATFTVTLCADVPSNSNPGASANYSAVSAGHTFLTVTKVSGGEKVSQSFGFYPKEFPGKTDTFSPLTSTMRDNGVREINASLEMKITEDQFRTIKEKAIELSSKKYELGDFNCTDYAMDVFNSVRPIPIKISPLTVYLPGAPNPYVPGSANTIRIEKSPQMLFLALKDRKDNNDIEAARIKIDLSDKYKSPESNGACN